ncbi:MAG: DNA polymerase III subunit delta [Nitrospinota bacterium]
MASVPGVAFGEALKALQAGRIASLYLLHGEEEYLQEELLAQIRSRLLDPATEDLNHQRLDAEDCAPEDIRTAAETLPFLGTHRLVVVRRSQWLEQKVGELKPVLENPPDSACLVLLSSTSLKASSPLLKIARKSGVAVSTEPLKGKTLGAEVRRMASRLGFSLGPEALALLLDRTGGSLRRAASELEKLSLHVDDAKETGREETGPAPEVSLKKVAAVVDDGRTENLFDLSDALGAREAAQALEALQRLLRPQHNSSAIIAAMGRHFVRLLEARALLDEGVPVAAVPRRLGGHPFYAGKLTDQALRFSDAELRGAVERLQRTDVRLKGSGLPDWALLEELTLALCGTGGGGEKDDLRKRRSAPAKRAPAG